MCELFIEPKTLYFAVDSRGAWHLSYSSTNTLWVLYANTESTLLPMVYRKRQKRGPYHGLDGPGLITSPARSVFY